MTNATTIYGSPARRLARAVIPKPVRKRLLALVHVFFPRYSRKSYSQEGEDILLERFIENRRAGFYIDVGAHHPQRFSNTFRLYQKGWRGINIDAIPGSMKAFRRCRPRDINVEAAVGARREVLTFYMFNEPAFNTFDRSLAVERTVGNYKVVREVKLPQLPLCEILDKHIPPKTNIDLLTVDVEGFDLEVLQSNNWAKYKPEFVLAECWAAHTAEQVYHDPLYQFLSTKGYSMAAKTMNTVLFKRQTQ